MAEETLVKEALTDRMIEAGASVLHTLDRGDVGVDAAFWLYLPDINQWRLVLAIQDVQAAGPRKAYKRVLQSLRNIDAHAVPAENIAIVDSRDPMIQVFRNAVHTGRSAGGFRFSRNTVNGHFIEDAYIYRTAA